MQARTLEAISHDTFGGIKARRGAVGRLSCLLRMGTILGMSEAARIEQTVLARLAEDADDLP